MTTTWNQYQEAIFAAVKDEEGGNLFVRARAGTGKTTTIVEALGHIPVNARKRTLFVAFNKSIATELQARAPMGVQVSTLHSFGFKAVQAAFGRVKVDGDKVRNRVREMADEKDVEIEWEFAGAVCKLVGLAKGCLVDDAEGLADLAAAYGVCDEDGEQLPRVITWTREVLAWCAETANVSVDFDDMVWLPVKKDLRIPGFEFVFVDEAQDLNAAQIELVCRAARKGRAVCVGDDRQAIYGFRGADSRATEVLCERLGCRVLPLSVTYRCGRAIVQAAQRFVPDFQAAPSNPEGIVRAGSLDELKKSVAAGDFILSRTNAPLVSLCLGFLAEGRRARIAGRDVGTNLAALVKKMRAKGIEGLRDKIGAWRDRESARLAKDGKDTGAIDDKADCILAIIEGCDTVPCALAKIERLFDDRDGAPAIVLSSTHKAKGLERDRVWMLSDTYRPGRGNTEEDNLAYVAITRAKHELIMVPVKAAPGEPAAA